MMDLVNFLVNTVMWMLTIRISTFLHELGHCLAVLAFTKENVKVVLGYGRMNASFTVRRLHVRFKGFMPWIGFMNVEEGVTLTKTLSLLLSFGGPLVSLIIGTSAFLFRSHTDISWFYSILSVIALYNCYLFFCTAIPIVYPKWWIGYGGSPSDGYRILRLIISKENTLQH